MNLKPVTEELFNQLRENAEKFLSNHADRIKDLEDRLALLESKSTTRPKAAK